MDLSKIPTEDLQAIQNGHWDKVSTPGLQQYQQQRTAVSQAQAQAAHPQTSADPADTAAQGGKPNAQPTSLAPKPDTSILGDGSGSSNFFSRIGNRMREAATQNGTKPIGDDLGAASLAMPAEAMTGPVLGRVGKLAQYLGGSGAGPMAARVGANAVLGGAQGALQSDDPVAGAKVGATVGGVLGAGGEALGGLSDLAERGANSMMKRAVGLVGAKGKSAPADIGNRIVDQGIWGTKSGMAEQANAKYQAAEQAIQDLAAQTPGRITGDEMGSTLDKHAQRFVDPETGKVASGGDEGHGIFSGVADDLRSRAPDQGYSAKGLMQTKRLGDENAFNQSGMMGNSYKADAYRAQGDASRSGLDFLTGGKSRDLLRDEQTLLLADKGLHTPDMTYKNPVSFTDMASGLAGAASHGLPGYTTGVLASKAATTPLAQSIGAHLAQRVAAPALAGGQTATPQAIQGLLEALSEEKQ